MDIYKYTYTYDDINMPTKVPTRTVSERMMNLQFSFSFFTSFKDNTLQLWIYV